MTSHRKMHELEASGQAAIVGTITPTREYTRDQLLEFVAKALEKRRNDTFKLYHWIEFNTSAEVKQLNISGTVFEVAAQVIKEKTGHVTDDRLGSIMRSLGLSQEDVHHLACDCHVPYRMLTTRDGERGRLIGRFAPRLFRDLKSPRWYQFWR